MALRRTEKLHALTSLRFFAALYVVLFHTFPVAFLSPASPLRRVLSLGFVSVSFFFFLSGYILATVYLLRGKAITLRKFFVARVARIYPIYLLSLAADVPRSFWQRAALYGTVSALVKTAITLVGHFFMLQAWTSKLEYALNPPAWSLSDEAFFYVLFPVFGAMLWKLKKGNVVWCAAAVYVAGQVLVWFATRHATLDAVKFNPALHVSTFLLGILLCRWQMSVNVRSLSPAAAQTILVGALIAFALIIWRSECIPYTNVHDGILAPLFAAVIVALSNPQTPAALWLSHRWLIVLGEASFALYLLHVVVQGWYGPKGVGGSLPAYAIYLSLCIGLSVLSFLFIETPTRNWITTLFKTRTPETMEASTDASA